MVSPIVFGFLVSLGMGLGAFAVFLWAIMDGQMEETEELKYRILEREKEDDAAAHREFGSGALR
jgi:cbb3-type cytochrome oxidase maturation protein